MSSIIFCIIKYFFKIFFLDDDDNDDNDNENENETYFEILIFPPLFKLHLQLLIKLRKFSIAKAALAEKRWRFRSELNIIHEID